MILEKEDENRNLEETIQRVEIRVVKADFLKAVKRLLRKAVKRLLKGCYT